MTKLSIVEFAEKILEVMPIIMRELITKQQDELLKGKITPVQFVILGFLGKRSESKMKDLAHFMDVSTAAMTGIVGRLFRDGCVTRVYDPKDRRVIKIKLTTKGSDILKRINQQRKAMIIEVFSQISHEQRQEYLRILMRIQDTLIKSDKNN